MKQLNINDVSRLVNGLLKIKRTNEASELFLKKEQKKEIINDTTIKLLDFIKTFIE